MAALRASPALCGTDILSRQALGTRLSTLGSRLSAPGAWRLALGARPFGMGLGPWDFRAPDDGRQFRTTRVSSGRRASVRTTGVSPGRRTSVPDDARQSR